VEEPPFELDQFGLNSYVDPDSFELTLGQTQKAIAGRSIWLSE